MFPTPEVIVGPGAGEVIGVSVYTLQQLGLIGLIFAMFFFMGLFIWKMWLWSNGR